VAVIVAPELVIVAVIVALPAPTNVANPLLLMVATLLLLLLHCTRFVMLSVVPSSKVPVAVNCRVLWVWKTDGLDGLIEMVRSLLDFTVRVAVPVFESFSALIVAVPSATAVATPDELTVATDVGEEDQVAEEVTSLVVPPAVVPVAVKFTVSPTLASAPVGDTVTEVMVFSETKKSPQPLSASENSTLAVKS
jgi:hypothetical protein